MPIADHGVNALEDEFKVVVNPKSDNKILASALVSMLPILLEALRIAMIFNFTGVMIAEMYASRTGIGHLIANWGENFQMRQLFAELDR